MTADDELQRLKRLILKSGFPLEIKVASAILELTDQLGDDVEIDVSTSPYFVDKDEGKGRELDVKVRFLIISEKAPLIILNLLIQCKNIPGNSWIFYKAPHYVHRHINLSSVLDAIGWTPRTHYDFVSSSSNLHSKRLPATTVYSEFVTEKKLSNGKNNNLFESIITLAKAASFDKESNIAELKRFVDTCSFKDLSYVDIYYTAVVFNGKMFIADEIEKAENMRLAQINQVGCYVDYASGSYDIDLIVDIINESALSDYIQLIKEDINELKKAASGKIGNDYLMEVSKAEKEYRGSSKRKLNG